MEGGALLGFESDVNSGVHTSDLHVGFDEATSCAPTLRVLKQLIQRCLANAVTSGNVYADALLQHLYRWLCRLPSLVSYNSCFVSYNYCCPSYKKKILLPTLLDIPSCFQPEGRFPSLVKCTSNFDSYTCWFRHNAAPSLNFMIQLFTAYSTR